jgi:hypothetical protein
MTVGVACPLVGPARRNGLTVPRRFWPLPGAAGISADSGILERAALARAAA